MEKDAKIYVAGHRGMVGSAIVRRLKWNGFDHIITRSSSELDLRNQQAVKDFFVANKPEYVFHAAAKVGGILANNTYRADFIYDNLMISSNVIHASFENNVKKLLYLGSSCIYPKNADQPLKEASLLSGYLEPTNQPYAIAKIAGIELCDSYRRQYGCNFIAAMPSNLYGPNDNYNLENSHVLPALLRKFITAKKSNAPFVELWGSGSPKREFLHVDDLSSACFFLMENFDQEGIVNIGCGIDISILDLAVMMKNIVGYSGAIKFDLTKPDGTPRKLMDVNKLNQLGWSASIGLHDGITRVFELIKDMQWD